MRPELATNEPARGYNSGQSPGTKLALVPPIRMSINALPEGTEANRSVPPVVDADPDIPDTAFRDAIPKLPQGEELFMRGFAAVAWLYGLYWIVWRWTSSLNPDALIFSIALIVAETYGLINSFFLIATVWKLNYRESPHTPKGLQGAR